MGKEKFSLVGFITISVIAGTDSCLKIESSARMTVGMFRILIEQNNSCRLKCVPEECNS
jgi:hypothetical protein